MKKELLYITLGTSIFLNTLLIVLLAFLATAR